MTTHLRPMPAAMVTGGAGGVGPATAQWFLAQGHWVALWNIGAATLQAAAQALKNPDRVLAVAGGIDAAGVGLSTVHKAAAAS